MNRNNISRPRGRSISSFPIVKRTSIQIIEDKKAIKSAVDIRMAGSRAKLERIQAEEALKEEKKRIKESKDVIKKAKELYTIELTQQQEGLCASGPIPENVHILYDSGIMITSEETEENGKTKIHYEIIGNGSVIKTFFSLQQAEVWFKRVGPVIPHPQISNYGKIKIYTKKGGFIVVKV